ncbi:MAG: tetratricopeptide repeat protein [Armatimonadetes bacterium]|nr:tetratricopeptide repeat protein [Armatimonadota bacterium]
MLAAALVVLMAAVAVAQVLPSFDTTRLYRTEAEFARAIQPYQRAIAANPRNARAHYWLGFAYVFGYRQWRIGVAPYASGYLERALPPLQEAIKLDPGLLAAYLVLHDAYALMGDDAKAEEVAQQMLQRSRPGWLAPVTLP